MATIVFTVDEIRPNYRCAMRLDIYHGDDAEVQFTKPIYQAWNGKWGKASDNSLSVWQPCPEMEDLPKVNEFPQDDSYDNCYKVVEPSSECEYNPLEVWCFGTIEWKDNLSCQGYSQETYQRFIADFFGIPTFDELVMMARNSGYKRFVVKRGISLKYTFVRNLCGASQLVVVTGTPKRIPYEVPWTKRFESHWVKDSDAKYYKKIIRTYRLAGDNGLALVSNAHLRGDKAYPEKCKEVIERMQRGEWIDYTEPSVWSEQTKENRCREEERKRNQEKQREYQKQLPGYCDKCGAEHAEFVDDPWSGMFGWYCRDCYNEMHEE